MISDDVPCTASNSIGDKDLQKIRQGFRLLFDRDQKGYADPNQIKELVKAVFGDRISEDQLYKAFADLGTSDDGKIVVDGFIECLLEMEVNLNTTILQNLKTRISLEMCQKALGVFGVSLHEDEARKVLEDVVEELQEDLFRDGRMTRRDHLVYQSLQNDSSTSKASLVAVNTSEYDADVSELPLEGQGQMNLDWNEL